ncbi:Malto-oligosyltrehalose trehalohydrolase [Aquisphaera giovannonii]|uniref:Malto-oligosyltrehalose trehalohydrolase n=1 Tax=Aquisphaera giovannonii TaxID=406548 RepID=A0A5B9VTJ7_9BACT|nr:alpha-amylase family glycosyl hydrolase [Aquisphaera giovannonii]QEH31602.1 Malto-oligosyltrehalose trehalohydrolase [Aquisphaera giovannonii]
MSEESITARRVEAGTPSRWPARGGEEIGAVPLGARGTGFRVWAPRRSRVEVVFEGAGRGGRASGLTAEGGGYFSGVVPWARAGDLYRYRLDGEGPYPDPASRSQPDGPFGPSQVVDPSAFAWSDASWEGIELPGQVLYEMHVGTFTEEGTWRAAEAHLPGLAELGVTAVEVMPVADFAGTFSWGYDGVNLFAPSRHYGPPDDFRRFVDRAHALGLGVLHDVVYNHLGPKGDFLDKFSDDYKSRRHVTEWGPGLNCDGPNCEPVRAFILANAAHWVREYHVDGLRIDAVWQTWDDSDEHIVAAVTRRAREAAGPRSVLIIGEDEPQESRLLRPRDRGGFGLDALWNDDFHHVHASALTRCGEGYYADYRGTPQEFVSLWKHGVLYQGQMNLRQGKPRGMPTRGVAPRSFVNYLENHDQVANTLRGRRLHERSDPSLHRALTALFLLSPGTPMLFQGQEFAASSPFLYFNDAGDGEELKRSRAKFLGQFPSLATDEARAAFPNPADPEVFRACRLKDADRAARPAVRDLHRDLLRLRREDPALRLQGSGGLDGAVLGPEAFVLRCFGEGGDDRIILVNLGRDFLYAPVAEPLLAPPEGRRWEMLWSSASVRYGGDGTPGPETADGWRLPRVSTLVLAARHSTGV